VYDFDRGVIASVLMGLAVDSGSLTRKIKSGAFKIVNEKDGILLLNDLTDVLKEIPRMNRIENRYLCREYIKFRKSYKKYNHKTFLQNLKKNADLFILATQEEDLLSEMFVKLCSK
jgi:predicted transcriptional regulator